MDRRSIQTRSCEGEGEERHKVEKKACAYHALLSCKLVHGNHVNSNESETMTLTDTNPHVCIIES